jgi:tryptophanyl-tRNA synthetase
MSQAQRVFSGITPSGDPHLGNYIGAILNWVADQDRYDNFFCVVDQHAITVPYDPAQLRVNLRQLAALLVACGIDPERSCLFVQSHVREHTELA